jgi:hypothetical protein
MARTGCSTRRRYILNDTTVAVLRAAGADPGRRGCGHRGAQRHDGRPHRRHPPALEAQRPHHTSIMAYSAKYASAFYGPFRDAVGSASQPGQGRQKGLPDGPRQHRRGAARSGARHRRGRRHGDGQARHALPRHRAPGERRVRVPTFAYQVSGEYAMLKAAAANGWLDHDAVMMESLLAFKRAGADGVLTTSRWTRPACCAAEERPPPHDARLPHPAATSSRTRRDLPEVAAGQGYLWLGSAGANSRSTLSAIQAALAALDWRSAGRPACRRPAEQPAALAL